MLEQEIQSKVQSSKEGIPDHIQYLTSYMMICRHLQEMLALQGMMDALKKQIELEVRIFSHIWKLIGWMKGVYRTEDEIVSEYIRYVKSDQYHLKNIQIDIVNFMQWEHQEIDNLLKLEGIL